MKKIFLMLSAFLLPALTGAAVLHAQMPAPGQIPNRGNVPGSGGLPAQSDAAIRSRMRMLEMDGSIAMRFANALNGEPIPGAQIAVDGAGIFTANAEGIALLPPMPDGGYTLTFSKSGFITSRIEFRVQAGGVVFNWFSISPGLEGRAWRFVLDWGERPEDLDIHLEKRGAYHISYFDMRTSADGNAHLDRDDRDGQGPETITVNVAENAAVYDLYVIDYTNRTRAGSSALSTSGAVLRVFNGNALVYSFSVPQGAGSRWNVLRLEGNRVVPVNVLAQAGR